MINRFNLHQLLKVQNLFCFYLHYVIVHLKLFVLNILIFFLRKKFNFKLNAKTVLLIKMIFIFLSLIHFPDSTFPSEHLIAIFIRILLSVKLFLDSCAKQFPNVSLFLFQIAFLVSEIGVFALTKCFDF